MAQDKLADLRAAAKARHEAGDDYVAAALEWAADEIEELRAAKEATRQRADREAQIVDERGQALQRVLDLCDEQTQYCSDQGLDTPSWVNTVWAALGDFPRDTATGTPLTEPTPSEGGEQP